MSFLILSKWSITNQCPNAFCFLFFFWLFIMRQEVTKFPTWILNVISFFLSLAKYLGLQVYITRSGCKLCCDEVNQSQVLFTAKPVWNKYCAEKCKRVHTTRQQYNRAHVNMPSRLVATFARLSPRGLIQLKGVHLPFTCSYTLSVILELFI